MYTTNCKKTNVTGSTLFAASRYEFRASLLLGTTRAWLQRTLLTIILAQVFNLCLLSQDNDPQPWQNGWFPTGAKQIHDSAFFLKGININGIQIDSVYAANDTLYFVSDSGIFKAILNPGSGGGAGFTQEEIEDFTGAMVTGNTETLIDVTYDDGAAKLNFVVDNDLSNYDNATSAFITDYTVTEGDVTAHEAAISITESQISDLQSYALNSTALENTTAPYTDADSTKLDGIETGATADQSDAEIETAYNNQVSIVSQGDAETGTSTTVYRWTPQRVAQAIAALSGEGGGTDDTLALFISNQEVIDSLQIDDNFTDNIYNETTWSIDSGVMYIDSNYFYLNDTVKIVRIPVNPSGGGSNAVVLKSFLSDSSVTGTQVEEDFYIDTIEANQFTEIGDRVRFTTYFKRGTSEGDSILFYFGDEHLSAFHTNPNIPDASKAVFEVVRTSSTTARMFVSLHENVTSTSSDVTLYKSITSVDYSSEIELKFAGWSGDVSDMTAYYGVVEFISINNTSGSSGGISSESDPVFTAHLANEITEDDTTRWGDDPTDNYTNVTKEALADTLDHEFDTIQLGGTGPEIISILDEDNLISDSDEALATQQSIKAYVDASSGLQDPTGIDSNLLIINDGNVITSRLSIDYVVGSGPTYFPVITPSPGTDNGNSFHLRSKPTNENFTTDIRVNINAIEFSHDTNGFEKNLMWIGKHTGAPENYSYEIISQVNHKFDESIILSSADTIKDISINNQRLEFQVNQSTFSIDNTVYDTSVTLDATDLDNLGTTSIEVLSNLGSGFVYDIISIVAVYNYGTSTYSSSLSGTLTINCGFKEFTVADTRISGQTVDRVFSFSHTGDQSNLSTVENSAVNITYDDDFTTGDGTLTLHITYKIITL